MEGWLYYGEIEVLVDVIMVDIPGFETLLVQSGVINEDDLVKANQIKELWGEDFGRILVKLGLISEQLLIETKSVFFNIEIVSIDDIVVKEEFLKVIPPKVALKHRIFPFGIQDDGQTVRLKVALIDPDDDELLGRIAKQTSLEVQPYLIAEDDMMKLLEQYYHGEPSGSEIKVKSGSFQAIKMVDNPEISQFKYAEQDGVLRINKQLAKHIRSELSEIEKMIGVHPNKSEPELVLLKEEYRRLLDLLSEKKVIQIGEHQAFLKVIDQNEPNRE